MNVLAALLIIGHVTVVDVDRGTLRRDVAIVIDGDRVREIQPTSRVVIPKGAKVIDAAGRFVIPGLWDMHVHLGDSDFDRDANLPLFVANGVTGIRIMEGDPIFHRWRAEGALAPRMVIASPFVRSVDEVRQAKDERADFIKVHDDGIPLREIVAAAKRVGLTVAGHVPAGITAEEASNAGMKSIEHLTGTTASSDFATFVRNDTWHTPTLIMRHNYALLDVIDDPRIRYAKPSWRARWLRMAEEARHWPAGEGAKRRETIAREDAIVGAMHKAGVRILAGTDNANPFVLPGFGLHDELELLVRAGLSPLDALRAATFWKKETDLVLLDANPLDDIRNTRAIHAVVLRGRYLDRAALDTILREVESAAK